MGYQPNIPGPNTNLSVSQGDLQGNFQALNTGFGVDHNKYDAVTNAGTHLQVTLPSFGTPGSPGGTASVIYTKNVVGAPVLYFKSSAGDNVVWTGGSGNGLSTLSTDGFTPGTGYLVLPNGLKFVWGWANISGASTSVTFISSFANQCQTCQISGIVNTNVTSATSYSIYNLTTTGFSFQYGSTTLKRFTYLAVGY